MSESGSDKTTARRLRYGECPECGTDFWELNPLIGSLQMLTAVCLNCFYTKPSEFTANDLVAETVSQPQKVKLSAAEIMLRESSQR